VVGATTVMTTAAEALAKGSGVCQDHAHVFIAVARLLGLPARYVSGYLWQGGSETASASHAWAEAHVPDFGWLGFDPANNICPTEKYVRVAIGLDYGEAAPVRGIRRGAADEVLTVAVDVQPAQAQQ
jgi:transglutaminase-like putative cysteine protease